MGSCRVQGKTCRAPTLKKADENFEYITAAQ